MTIRSQALIRKKKLNGLQVRQAALSLTGHNFKHRNAHRNVGVSYYKKEKMLVAIIIILSLIVMFLTLALIVLTVMEGIRKNKLRNRHLQYIYVKDEREGQDV